MFEYFKLLKKRKLDVKVFRLEMHKLEKKLVYCGGFHLTTLVIMIWIQKQMMLPGWFID
jgi:hypothetical protein